MMEQMVKENALGDLLGIVKSAEILIKSDPKNCKIIKHATTALGRLAETD